MSGMINSAWLGQWGPLIAAVVIVALWASALVLMFLRVHKVQGMRRRGLWGLWMLLAAAGWPLFGLRRWLMYLFGVMLLSAFLTRDSRFGSTSST